MKFFWIIFRIYIASSVHVAFSVLSLVFISENSFQLNASKEILIFVFSSSIVAYNFIKYDFSSIINFKAASGIMRMIQLITFISAVFMFKSFIILSSDFYVLGFVLVLLTVFYAFPLSFSKQSSAKSLRQINGLKVFIVAAVWALTTVVYPFMDKGITITLNLILEVVQRFILVLVLIIPFEIRDLYSDDLSLSTLPQNFGIRLTKVFGYCLILINVIIEYLQYLNQNIELKEFYVFIGITAIMGLLLFFSKPKQSKYYSSFWVEAVPILWCLFLIV